jgi:microcystin-dependent protein
MSNYNKATNFAVKDTLTSGDPDKVVSGAEIDNEFNSIASAVNSKADSSQLQALAPVPSGGIIIWSGTIASIPSGWALCNGANGTPDLRDRFVVGAGSLYNTEDTGGENSVQLTESEIPSHGHSMNSAGNHSHSGSVSTATLRGSLGFVKGIEEPTSSGVFTKNFQAATNALHASGSTGEGGGQWDFNGDHSHTVSINTDGSHTHTISNTGGDQSHENRPPYFALAYIMKL